MSKVSVKTKNINNRLEIRRPIAEVFQFLSNFENMPKWNYFVVNVKKISDGPVGLNTAFKQKRKTDSQEYKIIEYEPNKRVAIDFQPPSVKLTMRFTLQPSHDDNGTVVVDEWKFDTGIPALFARIRVTNVKAAVAENLDNYSARRTRGEGIVL